MLFPFIFLLRRLTINQTRNRSTGGPSTTCTNSIIDPSSSPSQEKGQENATVHHSNKSSQGSPFLLFHLVSSRVEKQRGKEVGRRLESRSRSESRVGGRRGRIKEPKVGGPMWFERENIRMAKYTVRTCTPYHVDNFALTHVLH